MNNLGELFEGKILILAPHMDDEALACGGLIAKLQDKGRIHLAYATDGMKSPSPIVPGRDSISPDLGEIRVQESIAAMSCLGVSKDNLHFLRLPEAHLWDHKEELQKGLRNILERIRPDYIFIPFRYDRHPDHLAINQIVTHAYNSSSKPIQIVEYFVYYRWKLLPRKDIRKYIHPQHLTQINIEDVAEVKRTALDCFTSQTTIFYPWQTRPILTATLLDEECQNPEYFLIHHPDFPGTAVFTNAVYWIRIAHRLEPYLQKWKYRTGALFKRIILKNV